jgi:hypothetical protein
MISNGSLLENSVTIKDIQRAENIYGKDAAVLKGKTVAKRPFSVKMPDGAIKRLYHDANVVLNVDIMYINNYAFVITVSERVGLLMVQPIRSKQTQVLQNSIESCIVNYRKEGFNVVMIKSDDGEPGIMALKNWLMNKKIILNETSKNQHVPLIERKIKQIKERCRVHIAALPYNLPRIILENLVIYCVHSINIVPQTITEHSLSPFEIYSGKKVNVKTDLKIQFGEYVQIPVDNSVGKNAMNARTNDAIALHMRGNLQGSAAFYNIQTGKVVHRDHWNSLPIPEAIIQRLNSIASSDNAGGANKNNLIFKYKENLINDTVSTEKVVTTGDSSSSVREVPLYNHELNQQLQTIADSISHADNSQNDNVTENVISEASTVFNNNDQVQQSSIITNDAITNDNDQQMEIVSNDINADTINNNMNMNNIVDEQVNNITTAVSNKKKKTNDRNVNFIKQNMNYSLRNNVHKNGGWNDFKFVGVHKHQDIQSAVKELGPKGVTAIVNELKQLLNQKVFTAVKYSDVPRKINGKVDCISSRTFMKEKSVDVAKARLVAGGHLQNKNVYSILEELYSPTVKGESTCLLLAIAAAKKMKIITMDIVGAYLNAKMDKKVYMVINKYESEILCQLDSDLRKYVHTDGKLYVILNKALYGCVESAKLFFNHMQNNLLNFGFVQSKYDECVFTFTDSDNNRCLIGCHVDDLLIACGDDKLMNSVVDYLKKQYNDVKVTSGN